ncbi:MAG TPA: ATP-binding protein [Candidatus Limnocylindrales bacterium]
MTNRFARRDMVPATKTLLIALAFSIIGVAVKLAIFDAFGSNAGFVIYIPAVAMAAWYRGFLAGILVTVLIALADTLLFLPPLFIIAVDVRSDQIRLIAFLAGGVAVSYLSHRLRNERDRARVESAERRRALQEAAQAREDLARLIHTERRASELRDAFNGIISHELRTPITAIYGGAKLLARRDRELDPDVRRELVADLEAETDRLYRLVEDLLVLSRSERGSIERADDPVVVARVVERVVRSEQERWPGVKFIAETGMATTARGDDTYVEQVLRNLLSNAAKYSSTGSTIRVIVDETAEGIRVRVLDEGAGLDPAETSRLFELYYRSPVTAGITGGAGIGLYVCRALVEAMGGRIWATPRPEGGAEFGFILGRQAEDATA